MAKPLVEGRSSPPPVARARAASTPPPPPEGDSEEAADDRRVPPEPKPRAAAGADAFGFLEDAYDAPVSAAPSSSTRSATVEALEKKRQERRKTQMILLAVMGSLVVVLLGLMLVLFLKQKKPEAPAKAEKTEATEEAKKDDEKAADDKAVEGSKKEPEKTAKKDKKKDSKKEAEPAWVDASKRSFDAGDINVKIDSAKLKPMGADSRPLLQITFKLANKNKEGKIIEYTRWNAAATGIRLVDNVGNNYRLGKTPGKGGADEDNKKKLYPKEDAVEDQLIFDRPVADAKYLHLTLPASAVGGEGSIYFEIPMSMVTKEAADPPPEKSTEAAPKQSEATAAASPPLPAVAASETPPAARPAARAKRKGDAEDEAPTGNPMEDFGIGSKSFKREKPRPDDFIQDPDPAEKPASGADKK